jgi:hypothetical protein
MLSSHQVSGSAFPGQILNAYPASVEAIPLR